MAAPSDGRAEKCLNPNLPDVLMGEKGIHVLLNTVSLCAPCEETKKRGCCGFRPAPVVRLLHRSL